MHPLIYISSQQTIFTKKTASSLETNLLHLHLLKSLWFTKITRTGAASHLQHLVVVSFLVTSYFLHFSISAVWIPPQTVVLFSVVPAAAGMPSWTAVISGCFCTYVFLRVITCTLTNLPAAALLNVFHRDAACFCNWLRFWHVVGWWYLLLSQLEPAVTEGQTFSCTARPCSPTATKTLPAIHSVAFCLRLRQLAIFRVRSCV